MFKGVGKSLWLLLFIQFLALEASGKIVRKERYDLQLSNTSPAVWGSNIKFHAQLFKPGSSEQPVDTKYFDYEWDNELSGLKKSLHNDYNASITECFDHYLAENDGDAYVMTVTVYDTEDSPANSRRDRLVARGRQTFYLTDLLNGELNVSQKLPTPVNPGKNSVFSTREPVHFRLNLTDRFPDKPVIVYRWFVNNTLKRITTDLSATNLTFNHSGVFELKVIAESDVLTCKMLDKKRGVFTKTLSLKDKAHILEVRAKVNVPVNVPLSVGTLFNGSTPFRLCWQILPSESSPVPLSNCSALLDTTDYWLNISTPSLGTYTIVLSLQNEVSLVNRSHVFTVFDPNAEGKLGESVLVPVLCSVIAMAILVIGFGYVFQNKISRRRLVEEADFDFHPSISESEKESTLASIRRTISSVFNRSDSINQPLRPVRSYGSNHQRSLSESQNC